MTEKPGPNRYLPVTILIVLFVLGLALRFWRIDFGYPDWWHVDEQAKITVVARIIHGQLPEYFLHPALMVNSVAALVKTIQFTGVEIDQRVISLAGRSVSAILGAATIFLTYLLGSRIGGRNLGLIAAALLAVIPTHVVHSRYFKEDVYLTATTLLAVLAMLRWADAEREGKGQKLALALLTGALALAASSKFVGAFLLPISVLWMRINGVTWQRLARFGPLMLIGYVVVWLAISPQVILDPVVARGHFLLEVQRSTSGIQRPPLYFWRYPDLGLFHFWSSLGPGMTWGPAILGAAGLLLVLRQRQWRSAPFLAALVCIIYYIMIEASPAKRGVDTERYALPCVPFLAIFAAWLVWQVWQAKLQWRVGAVVLLFGASLTHTIAQTDAFDPDTRHQARRWIKRAAPDTTYRVLTTSNYQISFPGDEVVREFHIGDPKIDVLTLTDGMDALVVSSFSIGRYDDFPHLSRKLIRRYTLLREEFPYVYYVKKPWWARAGFHNPIIEIRTRHRWSDEQVEVTSQEGTE